jgi:hypothetical protein
MKPKTKILISLLTISLLSLIFFSLYKSRQISLRVSDRERAFCSLYALMLGLEDELPAMQNIEDLDAFFSFKLNENLFKEIATKNNCNEYYIKKSDKYQFAESVRLPISLFEKDRIVIDLYKGIYWENSGDLVKR